MVDSIYQNAFKEVWDVLQNTDEELIKKIPNKFMDFLQNNMNKDYETNIKLDIPIDKQPILKETEAVLSLIYRSYWATEEEKAEFAKKDKEELSKENTPEKKIAYKNIDEIFKKRSNLNNVAIDNNLMVIQKQSFFKIFITKLLKIIGMKGK